MLLQWPHYFCYFLSSQQNGSNKDSQTQIVLLSLQNPHYFWGLIDDKYARSVAAIQLENSNETPELEDLPMIFGATVWEQDSLSVSESKKEERTPSWWHC